MPRKIWTEQQLIDAVASSTNWRQVAAKLGLKTTNFRKHAKHLDISHFSRKHSEEAKKKISGCRKVWCAENKNLHPWSKFNRKESVPEKIFGQYLLSLSITAYSQYTPEDSKRAFEIDYALPDLKIGFEVNGQQHYNSDGYLAPYYKERHDYLTSLGWTIHEIHYSECFDEARVKEIIKNAVAHISLSYSSSPQIVKYREVKNRNDVKKQNRIQILNIIKLTFDETHIRIKNGMYPIRRKVQRPSREELLDLIWKVPTVILAKRYGVSDHAIAKWCKNYGISKPQRGYWKNSSSIKLWHQKRHIEKICPCGINFQGNPQRIYCSNKCKDQARQNKK